MGTGKTTWAINYMNSHPEQSFIVIAPLLDECSRYQKEVTSVNLVAPKHNGKGKFKNFKELICEGKSIITTHALMKQMDPETVELLRMKNYTLIIDEALEVIEKYPIKKADLNIIFKQQMISIDEYGYLIWHDDRYDGDKYKEIKELCDLHTLMGYKDEDGTIAKILIWNFPVEFFGCFKENFIMTYLWNGSPQKAYFEFHQINYEITTLSDDQQLIPYDATLAKLRQINGGKKIHIYEGGLNEIGEPVGRKYPLTKTWYENCKKSEAGKAKLYQLRNNTKNYFRHILDSPSSNNMYTTYKDFRGYIKGEGYTKGFVSCTCRGTNDYSHKTALAYLINFNPAPEIELFMNHYKIIFDSDMFALATLLQWIWRSKIRTDDADRDINLYIPSKRMRDLLKKWMTGEI